MNLSLTVSEIWPANWLKNAHLAHPFRLSLNPKFNNVSVALYRPNFAFEDFDTGLIIRVKSFSLKLTV